MSRWQSRGESPGQPDSKAGIPAPASCRLQCRRGKLDTSLGCLPEDDFPEVELHCRGSIVLGWGSFSGSCKIRAQKWLRPLPNSAFFAASQLYGRRAPWEDPAKWVMDTYPWAASPQQHEWPPLLQLRPEDVGFDGYSVPREGSTSKQMPPSDAEGDPLVSAQPLEQLGPR